MPQRKVSAAQDLIISRNTRGMEGTPVFARTRIRVQFLFDSLIEGETIADFAKRFPNFNEERPSELLRRIAKLIESGELSV